MHAITGATALVGPSLTPIENAAVIVEGRAVAAVGPAAGMDMPRGAVTQVEGTLIPGFIDSHVHIGFYEPHDVLIGGVTTVRDLAWPPKVIAELAARSHADDFDGPTIVAAGPMLTAPGGYPTRAGWAPPGTGVEIAGTDQVERAVAGVAEAGFSIVKVALNPPVGPTLDLDTLSAIVRAAHDRGLRVTGHIYGIHELRKAITAGVDELAHMLMSDERIPVSLIEEMVSADMTIVPTLSVFPTPGRRTAIANLHAFRSAGGRVIYGTDLGNEGPVPGIDPTEVDAMAQAGMSGGDIIRAATVDAAAWLGLTGVGVIDRGADADMVLVGGDPLTEPRDLTEVRTVWRRGQIRER
jgi:imidazolonepropionase-like amidohydrolase